MGLKEPGLRGSLRNVSVGIDAIPDSVVPQKEIHSYPVTGFTTENWPDGIGQSDIDTINGPTFDDSLFGSEGGVKGDGVDDFAQSDTMGSFGSNINGSWAVAIPFSTTDNDGHILGVANESNDTNFVVELGQNVPDNKLGASFRDDSRDTQRINCTPDVNDGANYVVIIQSTGSSASDKAIYFEPNNDVSSIDFDDGPLGTTSNFDLPMTYFSRNLFGDVDSHLEISLNTPRWFDDSLTESERSDVFDAYSWYDPSTDAP